jgi:hypothetical protein
MEAPILLPDLFVAPLLNLPLPDSRYEIELNPAVQFVAISWIILKS